MRKTIVEYLWLFAIILGVSVFFYPTIWQQIVVPHPNNELVIQGETPVYEFVAETVRQNILNGQNPFAKTTQVLYPVGWKYALDDVAPINGFYFLFLRPFFTIHQSLMIIVLASVILSGMTMYALLKLLKVRGRMASIAAIIFCFTPFVSERIGAHPTYVALYLFTLPAIFFVKLVMDKGKKTAMAVLLGLSAALSFVTNLYFAVMLALMILVLAIVYFIMAPKMMIRLIVTNFKYLCMSVGLMLLILAPWIKEVWEVIMMGTIDKPGDWNDIIVYSADLTNIIIPSHFNPIYQPILEKLGNSYSYIRSSFETFIYPGALLLFLTGAYVFLIKKIHPYYRPLFIGALFFLSMTCGPYLSVLGTNLNIPMPYILIPYIPFIQMARAPGRFIVVFIFLITVVVAQVLQWWATKKIKWHWKVVSVVVIVMVFLLDQRVSLPDPSTMYLPTAIYSYLAAQPDTSPLLEIPFTIRDSIKYFGYLHRHYSSYLTLLHHQPIFGIYAGRVSNSLFAYYTENPVIGPIGKMIDLGNLDPAASLKSIDLKKMTDGINFYQVRYAITKDNEGYSGAIKTLLTELGYKIIMTDTNYSLWERQPEKVMVDTYTGLGDFDLLTLTSGWSKMEVGESGRWAVGRRSEIIFYVDDTKKSQFVIEAESIVKPQVMQVYVNQVKIGTITVAGNGYNRYKIPITTQLKNAENRIVLQFASTHELSKIIPNSQDERPLALHVKYIGLE